MASGAVPAASDFPKCAMGGTRSEFVRGIEPLENRVVPGSRPSVIALERTESYALSAPGGNVGWATLDELVVVFSSAGPTRCEPYLQPS